MKKKNSSLFGLPEEIKFCSKCIISNQRPNSVIEFKNLDDQKIGINIDKQNSLCDACNYSNTKDQIDWSMREKALIEILDKHRKASGYDCIVPGSGGKDSCYASHILKNK